MSKRRLTTEEFIMKAREVHKGKYDYSKVNYITSKIKIIITCPIHGDFEQYPSEHLYGKGCLKCSGRYKPTLEEFIEKARKVHGDKYDYSKVEYVNNKTDICIVCPQHGEFWMSPNAHISSKEGCKICGYIKSSEKQRLTKEEFIQRAKEIHGDKYDYSKVDYKNMNTEVCIICPIHGEFWQTPSNHIHNKGECYECAKKLVGLKCRMSTGEFICKAKKIHGDKYDYSKTNYITTSDEVCIICPKHGEFWQKPKDHLQGNGCRECQNSKLENFIKQILINNKFTFITQYKFNGLKTSKFTSQSLDFYLPDYNIAIECQGEQHFKPVDFGSRGKEWAKENLKYIQKLDKRKRLICEEKGISILYFARKKYNDEIITDTNILLKKIKEHDKLRTDAD